MQTFLPHPSFSESAICLDRQRLGKQRLEVCQILNTLHGFTKGWKKHPAVLMWKGYEPALIMYGYTIVSEWERRGYEDNTKYVLNDFSLINSGKKFALPDWFGDPSFHLSHQSNLVRKFPEYYGLLFPGVPSNLPYFWPTNYATSH